ncbi:hypothetical protein AB6A23_06160 [Paenibacillus tarimensis]
MNSPTIGVLKMILADLRTSFYVILSILLVIYVTLTVIALRVVDGEVTVGGLSPLHIYMFVIGIAGFKETLAYALGMSVRRTDYFRGVLIAGFGTAAVSSFAITLLSEAESAVFAQFDLQVKVFHLIGFESVGTAGRWLANFIFHSFEYVLGFMFALLYKRFGAIGLYVLVGAFLLAAALAHLLDGWGPVFVWLGSLNDGLEAALWLLPLLAFNIVVSYALIRRVTV